MWSWPSWIGSKKLLRLALLKVSCRKRGKMRKADEEAVSAAGGCVCIHQHQRLSVGGRGGFSLLFCSSSVFAVSTLNLLRPVLSVHHYVDLGHRSRGQDYFRGDNVVTLLSDDIASSGRLSRGTDFRNTAGTSHQPPAVANGNSDYNSCSERNPVGDGWHNLR